MEAGRIGGWEQDWELEQRVSGDPRFRVSERACGSKVEELFVERPLFRFPLRGQTGAGGFPLRRKHDARQQNALSRIDAAGYPHKRAAAPLCIPCSVFGRTGLTSRGPLMEAATARKRSCETFFSSLPGKMSYV